MDGVRIYFEIQLDEEAILADGYDHSDLEVMHNYMDEAFKANDCHLEKIDGKKRIYTRDVDDKDLGYLCMAAGMVEKKNWFEKYACHYMFYIYDEEEMELDAEEDWLEDIRIRRSYRARVQAVVTDMKNAYGDTPEQFFKQASGCSAVVKDLLAGTSYHVLEEEEFILCHKKDLGDYKEDMSLFSVSLDRCETVGIATLVCLMQKNQFPDSVIVAFMKNTEDRRLGIQKLTKLLKKAKRTFRAVVLDVTNTGWEEECDYTIENCYLTRRMYKNLISSLHGKRRKWKIIPEDKQILKGILYTEEYFTENDSIKNEGDYFRENGIHGFSFCLPVEERIIKDKGLKVNLHRLGWYMYKLVQLANR